jgi:hypothetical protein
MPRILLLIVLVWILYQIIKRLSANAKQAQFGTKKNVEEKIVLCHHCGCHVPISESMIKNNEVICNNPDCNKSERNK